MADLNELIEKFKALVKYHDLTYVFSDDSGAYRIGQEQHEVIRELAKQLPREEAIRLWNESVDEKMSASVASQFYWK